MSVALVYLVTITLAEIFTAILAPWLGIILHSLILLALILQGATTRDTRMRRLLIALALAPLIRLLSISLPLQNLPLIDWYLVIGTLLYLGTFFTLRFIGLPPRRLGFRWQDMPLNLGLVAFGFGLGFVEFWILKPRPLINGLFLGEFLYAAFVLLIFTGFLEEIIFRGLLQDVSTTVLGKMGLVYSAVLFAVLHIGYLSVPDVVFVLAVGLFFGWVVQRTGSLLGVSLAHGFTNISMYLIYPFVLTSGALLTPIQVVTTPQPMPVTAGTSVPAGQSYFWGGIYPTPALESQSFAATSTGTPTPTLPPSPSPLATYQLPLTSTPETCGVPFGWPVYRVQPGDSLSAIARATGTTVARLQTANCLSSTNIYVGQALYVPVLPILPTGTPTLEPASPTPTETETPTLEATATSDLILSTDTPPVPPDTETPTPPTETETPPPPTDLPPTETLVPSDTPPPTP